MDRNCPESYIEPSVNASIADTEALIKHIRSLTTNPSIPPLVYPILTPRFAICCTPELLTSLGELAKGDPTLHIQTHLSENPTEIKETKKLFPNCPTYASVYDHFGLLRENTVLAHCIHLEEEEFQLIRQRDAGISHCPVSNFNLRSGVARVGEMLDRGIKVIGTQLIFRPCLK
jgi:guanine deaminase